MVMVLMIVTIVMLVIMSMIMAVPVIVLMRSMVVPGVITVSVRVWGGWLALMSVAALRIGAALGVERSLDGHEFGA